MAANDKKAMDKQRNVPKSGDVTYTKAQILKSKQFSSYHDVLNVVLADDKGYTFEEVLQMANDFLARPVEELVNE